MYQFRIGWDEAEALYDKRQRFYGLRRQGLKECANCKSVKPHSDYYRFPAGSYHNVCNACKGDHTYHYNKEWKDKHIFRFTITNIRKRVKNRGLACNIDAKYLTNLYAKQKGRCALTGLPMNLVANQPKSNRCTDPYKASLDRIDPTKGYVKGNVRWVLFALNVALSDWGESVYHKIASAYLTA